jgi:hypothetical protein
VPRPRPQPANDLALLRKRHKDEEDKRRKEQMDQRIKDLRWGKTAAAAAAGASSA